MSVNQELPWTTSPQGTSERGGQTGGGQIRHCGGNTKKTVYAALLRFLTPSLLFPLQFIFVLVNLPEHCFVCRLKLQRRSERTGGGEVLWETALTLTSPGTTAALAASHFCAVFSMEGLWPLTASKHPLFCTYLLLVWWAPRCPGAWPWIIAVDAYIWSNFIGFKLRAFFCFL